MFGNEFGMADIRQKWYVLNFIMDGTDLLLCIRNKRLDRMNGIS